MHIRHNALVFIAFLVNACASAPPPAPTSSGWTVRYSHRSGESASTPRTMHPELTFALLDGRARISPSGVDRDVRIDHGREQARVCRSSVSLCTPTTREAALVELTETESLAPPAGSADSTPTITREGAQELIANLHTEGARFEAQLRNATGTTHFVVLVRWIAEPGDANAETVTRVFTTPLERLGAHRLSEAIRQTVGLPLLFDVTITDERPDGTTANATDVYRALALENPPSSL